MLQGHRPYTHHPLARQQSGLDQVWRVPLWWTPPTLLPSTCFRIANHCPALEQTPQKICQSNSTFPMMTSQNFAGPWPNMIKCSTCLDHHAVATRPHIQCRKRWKLNSLGDQGRANTSPSEMRVHGSVHQFLLASVLLPAQVLRRSVGSQAFRLQ